ncbi:MAG: cation:proton antiporter [Armatimonadota bacterium]
MELEQLTQAILYITIILIGAKVFGEVMDRIGQPPVLGELIVGIVLSATIFKWMKVDLNDNAALLLLAELGVILLLFEIGLESDVEEFLRVGPSALVVAIIGVICPFVVGYLVSHLMGCSTPVAIFLGATLTATSVGITARTLSDLRYLHSQEAKTILGAAVIDDVLGLIILAVVAGITVTGHVSASDIVKNTVLAVVFLVGSIILGVPIAPFVLKVAKKLRTRGVLTISAFLFCLVLALIAHEFNLATIVGAFAAGLVLARTEDQVRIQERIRPIADILIPIFFVMVGIRVDTSVFDVTNPESYHTLGFMALLVVVAITMKLLAGFGTLGRKANGLIVGVGMVPRGEVGLIFASIGLARHIITPSEYAAIVGVVLITTFVTPPMLSVLIKRQLSSDK